MINFLNVRKIHKISQSLRRFYFTQQTKLNNYLQQRLNARKLFPMKDFQKQAFKVVAEQNKNCFINSCTGSGKTLAYLVPIINKILHEKDQILSKSPKPSTQVEYQNNQKHGALIFTLNKQLCLQVYKELRLIDIQNRLNVYRIGPISHFAPVVQLLNKKQKTPEDQDEIADAVETNIIKCVNWAKTDVLIATPQMFYNIMAQMIHNKNNLINPKFIVFDEADLLLQIDQNVASYTKKIIDLLKNEAKNKKDIKNMFHQQKNGTAQDYKFIMSSSSFPKKINKIPFKQYLDEKFDPISIVTGVNKHRLPQRIDLKYIQITSKPSSQTQGSQDQQVQRQKLFYLAKILNDPQKKENRFIIFCNSRKNVQKVSQFLTSNLNISCIQYYANLPSDQRSLNLYKFMNQSYDVLVSTDLGSRGLDFSRPIHTVIEYDMSQNIVNFINRAGRTARNQTPGEVISFVEQKNKIFFNHLAQKNSHDEEFDDLFSRKRSYNKLILKNMQQKIQ